MSAAKISRAMRGLALEFAALFACDLVAILATALAAGPVMNATPSVPPFETLAVLLLTGCFALPVLIGVLVFWRLGKFSFRQRPWRSAASLGLCILTPVVTYAIFLAVGLNGCWHAWLAGGRCGW